MIIKQYKLNYRIVTLFLILITPVIMMSSSFAVDKAIVIKKNPGAEHKTSTTIKHVRQLQIVKHCEPTEENPYANFNFLVEIDGVIRAGFQECSGLDLFLDAADYRGTYSNGKTLSPSEFQTEQEYHSSVITLKNGISDNKFNITDGANIKIIIVDKPKQPNKQIAMKYLDNLISWGDISFSQDTFEVIDCSSDK